MNRINLIIIKGNYEDSEKIGRALVANHSDHLLLYPNNSYDSIKMVLREFLNKTIIVYCDIKKEIINLLKKHAKDIIYITIKTGE